MKYPDFDKAFAPTPEIVSLSIESAFRKGEKAMKFRHKLTAVLSSAAVLALAFAVIGLANPAQPQPDVLSQPTMTAAPTAAPTLEMTEEPMVYYTTQGVYYHFDAYCSGMRNAARHNRSDAIKAGKQACPICVAGENTELSAVTEPYATVAPTSFPENWEDWFAEGENLSQTASDLFIQVFGVIPEEALGKGYESIQVSYYDELPDDSTVSRQIHLIYNENGESFDQCLIQLEINAESGSYSSGNINYVIPDGFDATGFYEMSSPWYQSAVDCADDVIRKFTDSENTKINDALTQIKVFFSFNEAAKEYFDSTLSIDICDLTFQMDESIYELSFDISNGKASLASMDYSKTMA